MFSWPSDYEVGEATLGRSKISREIFQLFDFWASSELGDNYFVNLAFFRIVVCYFCILSSNFLIIFSFSIKKTKIHCLRRSCSPFLWFFFSLMFNKSSFSEKKDQLRFSNLHYKRLASYQQKTQRMKVSLRILITLYTCSCGRERSPRVFEDLIIVWLLVNNLTSTFPFLCWPFH